MRDVPAYSLEEFLYEKTNRVEAVSYGIESRFWFAGKDIPDSRQLQNYTVPPDRTFIEDILFSKNIPISEFVILSYIKDVFYRNEKDVELVIHRIIPPMVPLDEVEWDILVDYISDSMEDFYKGYSLFLDKNAGPIRQRVAELHTAVIELSAKLQKGEVGQAWLPRHTFIVLSQIQGHSAAMLEELAFDDSPPDSDITAMHNSLDSMVDTYSEVKELINDAMDNFRRSSFTVIHGGKTGGQIWRMIQIGIGGLDIWRRAIVSQGCSLEELHKVIQIGFNWKNVMRFRFYTEDIEGGREYLHNKVKLDDIDFQGKKELTYEYGANWTVKIIIMSSYQPAKDEEIRFVAGEGAAPPEDVEGPRSFRKLVYSIEAGHNTERQSAISILGDKFTLSLFELDKTNKKLRETFSTSNN
jgi:hypothetical protein